VSAPDPARDPRAPRTQGRPLYGIQNLLRAGVEKLTDRQWTRFETAIAAHEDHVAVQVAWSCAQQLRSAYQHHDVAEGKKIAVKIIEWFPTCPIPEIARLGRTLKRWRDAFLAYFTTNRSSNGGTEVIWTHRTPPPRRPRVPQPRQLPTTHAPHRRRTDQPPPQVGRAALQAPRTEGDSQHQEKRNADFSSSLFSSPAVVHTINFRCDARYIRVFQTTAVSHVKEQRGRFEHP